MSVISKQKVNNIQENMIRFHHVKKPVIRYDLKSRTVIER